MKIIKVALLFTIILFIMSSVANLIEFASWISGDIIWLEYTVYLLFALAVFYFLGLPMINYRKRPTLEDLTKAIKGDPKAYRKVTGHYKKILELSEKKQMESAMKTSQEAGILWLQTYLEKLIAGFDSTIRQYAFKMTATVMLSPNSLIDGITILFGNARLIYTLSKRVHLRYTLKELGTMYFSIFSIASLSGLLEEFDEAIEDMAQEFLEEFSEFMEEQTGRTVGDSLPVVGIFIKSLSPIIQAAGNYAFIIYNGNRFKYRLLSSLTDSGLSDEDIRRKARKDARKARFKYIEVMIRNLGKKSTDGVKSKLSLFKRKKG